MVIAIIVPQFLQKNENLNNQMNQNKMKSVMKIMRGNAIRACHKKTWCDLRKTAIKSDLNWDIKTNSRH